MTETGTVYSFVEEAPHLVPQPFALLLRAREWIEQETTDRLAYYSAQEEEPVPPIQKKAAAKAKRVTVNQLSEQVTSIATLLPGLLDQVHAFLSFPPFLPLCLAWRMTFMLTIPAFRLLLVNDAAPALEPYRSLDVSRLKLSGRGQWDPSRIYRMSFSCPALE